MPPDAIFELKIHHVMPFPQNPTPALGPAGLEFSALGLKAVVHPCTRYDTDTSFGDESFSQSLTTKQQPNNTQNDKQTDPSLVK